MRQAIGATKARRIVQTLFARNYSHTMRMRPAACESFRQTSGFDGSALVAGLVLAAGCGGTAAVTGRGRGRAFAGAGLVGATC